MQVEYGTLVESLLRKMLKFKLSNSLNIIQHKGDIAEICLCLIDSGTLSTLACCFLYNVRLNEKKEYDKVVCLFMYIAKIVPKQLFIKRKIKNVMKNLPSLFHN